MMNSPEDRKYNRQIVEKWIEERGYSEFLKSLTYGNYGFGNVQHMNVLRASQNDEVMQRDKQAFLEKLSNKDKYSHLKALGFVNEDGSSNFPKFKYNSLGYRSDEFSSDKGIVTLGCSDTFGVAQKLEKTWSYYVSKKVGGKLYNLAIPGASPESNYMDFRHYANIFSKGTKVFWLIPSCNRMTIHGDNFHQNINIKTIEDIRRRDKHIRNPLSEYQLDVISNYYLEFYNNLTNIITKLQSLIDAVKGICFEYGLVLYLHGNPMFYSEEEKLPLIKAQINNYPDRAADLDHLGVAYQQFVADKFIEML